MGGGGGCQDCLRLCVGSEHRGPRAWAGHALRWFAGAAAAGGAPPRESDAAGRWVWEASGRPCLSCLSFLPERAAGDASERPARSRPGPRIPPLRAGPVKPPACERDRLCRKWVSVRTVTTEVNLRPAGGADAQEASGLMRKLSDFPDDRAEEAEAAHRPPGTPSAHERQPPAARVSRAAPAPPLARRGSGCAEASVNTPCILDVHDR